MSVTKFELVSNALVLSGNNVISSFSDGTTESVVAGQLYPMTAELWLGLYDWRFAERLAQLSQVAETPLDRWQYSYQVPPNLLKLRAVRCNGVGIDYQRFGQRIYCDYSTDQALIAEYTADVDFAEWPAYFRGVVQNELAAQFAISLAHQRTLSDTFKAERDRIFKLAKLADAQQKPAGKFNLRHAASLISRR